MKEKFITKFSSSIRDHSYDFESSAKKTHAAIAKS